MKEKLDIVRKSTYSKSTLIKNGDEINLSFKWTDLSDKQSFSHYFIFPKSTYSPWFEDVEFFNTYMKVRENTLVDIYRCYELWKISKQLQHKDGAIIEVGVWRGGTGAILAKASENRSTVYLCDTFTGVVKAGEKDSFYKGGEHADSSRDTVTELMRSISLSNYQIVEGIFPDESSREVHENSFKICHIDVDVYQSAKDIFEWVWPRLIPGGVVIFDDYGFAACEGITMLVNELVDKTKNALFIHNINGHGLLVKIND